MKFMQNSGFACLRVYGFANLRLAFLAFALAPDSNVADDFAALLQVR